jgi:hypothetical protein
MKIVFKCICIVITTTWLFGCGYSSIILRTPHYIDPLSQSKQTITMLMVEFKDYRSNPNYIGKINGFSLPITLKELKFNDGRTLKTTLTSILYDTVSNSGFNVLIENDSINKFEINKFDYLLTGEIDSFDVLEQRGFIGSQHATCDIKILLKITNPKNGKVWSTYYTKYDNSRHMSGQEVANIALSSILKEFHQDLINKVYLYDLK